jgi:hypothetical protein
MERYRPTYILAAATPFRKAVAYSEFGHGLLTEAILEILGGSDTPNGDSSAGQLLSAKQLQKRLSIAMRLGHRFPFRPLAGTPHGPTGGSHGQRGVGGRGKCLHPRPVTIFLGCYIRIFARRALRECVNANL